MKKSRFFLFSIVLFILVLVISVYSIIFVQVQPVNKADESIRFEVSYGQSAYDISYQLKSAGIIKNNKLFYYFLRFPEYFKIFFPGKSVPAKIELKSGIYYVNSRMTFPQISELLSSGQTEHIKVSVPEGLTISKIGKLLEKNKVCSESDFKNACYSISLAQKYNIPAESVEGYLFPDTYFLSPGMSGHAVAEIMIDNFFEKIKAVQNLAEKNSADLHQTVILASIVEREYRVDDEAPLIASVFKNRLRRNIGLYSCATLEYIITEILGRDHPEKILIQDTKIDNPYNTYMWAGLTPGPISNPGLISLDAATNTPKTNYYFFQVSDPSQGRHVFTTTFEEHKDNHTLYTKKVSE